MFESSIQRLSSRMRRSARLTLYAAALSTLLLGTLSIQRAHASLRIHWEDRFSSTEQQQLTQWLEETHGALEALVGALPFTTHLYMHSTESNEPVPWAHTERGRRQGVHFYVDASHSLEAFRKDWTAPHELSHLVIPYVGQQNSWFAEGFASYMQYQVMHRMGVLSELEMQSRYRRNLSRAASRYSHHTVAFAEAARRLRAERNYPTMYWGGAAFFLAADTELTNAGRPGLIAILREYLRCCRMRNQEMIDVIATLDRLAEHTALTPLLKRYQTQPGFPSFEDLKLGPSG